ncbi:MAG: hypothetical protein J0G32_08060 [Alphaproteobacteria bacterium]|nr:hypothetical protein [Alphaproteobacteria bacterium]OJV15999.1 MAG: hypothetical protein BGO27_04035 [Alphaproteobacteria bacterium 33-17]
MSLFNEKETLKAFQERFAQIAQYVPEMQNNTFSPNNSEWNSMLQSMASFVQSERNNTQQVPNVNNFNNLTGTNAAAAPQLSNSQVNDLNQVATNVRQLLTNFLPQLRANLGNSQQNNLVDSWVNSFVASIIPDNIEDPRLSILNQPLEAENGSFLTASIMNNQQSLIDSLPELIQSILPMVENILNQATSDGNNLDPSILINSFAASMLEVLSPNPFTKEIREDNSDRFVEIIEDNKEDPAQAAKPKETINNKKKPIENLSSTIFGSSINETEIEVEQDEPEHKLPNPTKGKKPTVPSTAAPKAPTPKAPAPKAPALNTPPANNAKTITLSDAADHIHSASKKVRWFINAITTGITYGVSRYMQASPERAAIYALVVFVINRICGGLYAEGKAHNLGGKAIAKSFADSVFLGHKKCKLVDPKTETVNFVDKVTNNKTTTEAFVVTR